AGTVGIELIGGLGVQPAHSAAKTQPLGGDHAAVSRGEALAEDAGVELVHGLVGHGGQAVVAGIVAGHGHLVEEFLGGGLVGDEGHLALVHHGVKLVHNHMVENLAEVLEAQAGVVGGIGDAYSNLVALAGVHHAFHVVKPGVD